MLTFLEFHNALRILTSIDSHELEAAGVHLTAAKWSAFQDNPWRFFIRCDDDTARKVWSIVQARQPKREAA